MTFALTPHTRVATAKMSVAALLRSAKGQEHVGDGAAPQR